MLEIVKPLFFSFLSSTLIFSTTTSVVSVRLFHLRPSRGRCRPQCLRPVTDSGSAGTEPEEACCCSVLREITQSAKMLRITVRAEMGSLWVLFCIIYSQFLAVSSDDIVVACGGFVKSDVEINYSLIEVRVQPPRLASS